MQMCSQICTFMVCFSRSAHRWLLLELPCSGIIWVENLQGLYRKVGVQRVLYFVGFGDFCPSSVATRSSHTNSNQLDETDDPRHPEHPYVAITHVWDNQPDYPWGIGWGLARAHSTSNTLFKESNKNPSRQSLTREILCHLNVSKTTQKHYPSIGTGGEHRA